MAEDIIRDPRQAANYLLRRYRDEPDFEFTQEEAGIVHSAYEGRIPFIENRPVMDEGSTVEFLQSQAADPSFVASEDEFQILRNTDPTFMERVGAGAAGVADYVGDVVRDVGTDVAQNIGRPSSIIKAPATAIEAASRTALDLTNLGQQAFRFGEKLPLQAMGAAGLMDDYQSYLEQKKVDQEYSKSGYQQFYGKTLERRQAGESVVGMPKEAIMPGIAEAGSFVTDPTNLIPFGVGAKSVARGTMAANVASKVGAGLEATARTAAMPVRGLLSATEAGVKAIPEGPVRSLAGKAAGLVEAPVEAIDVGLSAAEKTGQAARAIGQEALTGPSQFTVMERIAKNADNPAWLRQAANLPGIRSQGLQEAVGTGLDMTRGAVQGAGVGAGIGLVGSGGEAEGIGGGAALGAPLGAGGAAIGRAAAAPQRKAIAQQADINRFFENQAKLGLNVERIAEYAARDNRPFLDAATFQRIAPDTQVEFHTRDSFMLPDNAGIDAAGAVKAVADKSGRIRMLVNLDDTRATGDTVRHEMIHALMKSPAINKSEGRMAVFEAYGDKGVEARGAEYARNLLMAETDGRRMPTEAEVRAKMDQLRDDTLAADPNAGPLGWAADEILAEQFQAEFKGVDLNDLRTRTPPGTNLARLQEGFLAPVGRALSAMGLDLNQPTPVNIDTIFKDSPLAASPRLRQITSRWFRERDRYLDGIAKGETTKAAKIVPGAGNRNLSNNPAITFTRTGRSGILENDFAYKFPDGTVRLKNQPNEIAAIRAVETARVKDVQGLYDPNKLLDRADPGFGKKLQNDGKDYVGGPNLPEGFYRLDSFNEFHRQLAKEYEAGRNDGRTYSIWYQKIGSGDEGSWAAAVKKNLGNVKVGQAEIAPVAWRLSKNGNVLLQAVDITALRARMLDLRRAGKGRIEELWGGDLDRYQQDLFRYLDNHRNDLPGDNGIGSAKRDALNYLFGFSKGEVNPLAAEGRPPGSLFKSYRLDRIANSRATDRTGYFIDYGKQVMNLAPGTLDITRQEREVMVRVPLRPEDKQVIQQAAEGKTKLSSKAFKTGIKATPAMIEPRVREIKARFPQAGGWARIDLADVEVIKPSKAGADPKINPVFKPVPYSFEKDPKTGRDTTATRPVRIQKHSDQVVSEVMKVVERARAGDANAQNILGHKSWYRGMNAILRRSFGGMADYFADLLGAFSPNTSVDINWRFGVEALGKVMKGDYDKILKKADEWVKSGRSISEYKQAGNPMILQENQKLFGMNSDNGMLAMLDLWRNIQTGQAPKARNFALNLVGQSLKATIDVWAARFLQRLAGLERVPTVAETGVTGNVLTDVTKVGGQFGYGQDVFELAVQKLRKSGIDDFKDITAPDLQAIVWFLEKEIWAKNNWTSKTGEGGSFELEADLTQPARYVIGLSQETKEFKPTAEQQASFASDIRNTISEAPGVIATKIKDSFGSYMGTPERSFDAEFVVTPDFDPAQLLEVTAVKAMSSGQQNAFVSRVLGPNEENVNARPGMEIYLRKKGSMADVEAIARQVSELGIDGFTMIVDPRAKVAGSPEEFIGIRYQYIPEFTGDKNWTGKAEQIRAQLQDLADNIMSQAEVAFANVVKYDTLVIGETEYGNFNTRTGAGYTQGRGAAWLGRTDRARNEAAASGTEGGRQAQRPTGFQRVGSKEGRVPQADVETEVRRRAIREELQSPAALLSRRRQKIEETLVEEPAQ